MLRLYAAVRFQDGPSQGIIWPVNEAGDVLLSTSGNGPMAVLVEAWRELENAYDSGKVRAIGVSNMPTALLGLLFASARVKPHVHQFEAHPQLPQVLATLYVA